MNPLTRTFVRKHCLDAEVFRRAARSYALYYADPANDFPGGCCHALRRCAPDFGFIPYRTFFFAAMSDEDYQGYLYLWAVPNERASRRVHEMLTPRLIALELCALMVEDLSGPATHVPKK